LNEFASSANVNADALPRLFAVIVRIVEILLFILGGEKSAGEFFILSMFMLLCVCVAGAGWGEQEYEVLMGGFWK
jgi:hypothetical protein